MVPEPALQGLDWRALGGGDGKGDDRVGVMAVPLIIMARQWMMASGAPGAVGLAVGGLTYLIAADSIAHAGSCRGAPLSSSPTLMWKEARGAPAARRNARVGCARRSSRGPRLRAVHQYGCIPAPASPLRWNSPASVARSRPFCSSRLPAPGRACGPSVRRESGGRPRRSRMNSRPSSGERSPLSSTAARLRVLLGHCVQAVVHAVDEIDVRTSRRTVQ